MGASAGIRNFMTLEQLRIFVAVAEREHVTRAAEALYRETLEPGLTLVDSPPLPKPKAKDRGQ